MLTEIYLSNYLFVVEQRLAIGPGMTVLSGETGAGKSILVGAVSLIFGDSAPGLEPYDPALPVYLEASFDISKNQELQAFLREQGHETEAELCLARELSSAGKSSYFLNGRKVAASLPRELKPLMIDFHHQRDQQRLLNNAYQLNLLDLYAKNHALRDEFSRLYDRIKSGLAELDSLRQQAEDNRQLSELYQYQFDELDKAALKPGEDKDLQQEFELLGHAREISELSGALAYDLYEREESVHSRLSQAIASLSRYAGLNPGLAEISQNLSECQDILSDAASGLGDLSLQMNADPGRLEEIRLRLDLINSLLYKHKVQSIAELLDLFAQREKQIGAYAELGERVARLEARIEQDFTRLRTTGDRLSVSRQKAAHRLSRELQENICLLSLPEAAFKIMIDKMTEGKILIPEYLETCSSSGQDRCQFYFSANQGSELKPLAAVASGGELSRILLAIKKVLSERIEEKLIILDEIDAGIGGKTAEYVAQYIFRLARRHRILCVTHLAQIAAIADSQIALQKDKGKRKNVIRMIPLDESQRLEELARMLAGDVSPVSLKHANELMNKYRT